LKHALSFLTGYFLLFNGKGLGEENRVIFAEIQWNGVGKI